VCMWCEAVQTKQLTEQITKLTKLTKHVSLVCCSALVRAVSSIDMYNYAGGQKSAINL
jgi:hypothetical protein